MLYMNFDAYINQAKDGSKPVQITSEWMQGRAGYGGLVAALVYSRMNELVSDDQLVRCLQISFVGPVDESPFELSAELLRQGKNVTHVMGRGIQNGEVKVIVQGSFGLSRDSAVDLPMATLELEKPVDKSQKLPYIPKVIPEFTKHFDFRYGTAFPFAGVDTQHLEGYVRFDEAPEQMTEAHLLGLIDAWPPATLPLFSKPCMASSLSWTVEFVQPMPALAVDEYTRYRADILDSRNGYGYTKATISNDKGEVLALSQQTVTHFG
jgi:acyl-CoA thioesterase